MAKQKYEITAFTKGIIGSPSETDIPEDAASYSVNIDPNAEDGTLRGINKDSILDKSGFKQSSSEALVYNTPPHDVLTPNCKLPDTIIIYPQYQSCNNLPISYCESPENSDIPK